MIIDVTDVSFEAEVLQRSTSTPVVVDLWAPWCGPCRTLTPILEKVVSETNGKVVLAKVNIDENPQISQAFQVQSIPAVFALDQGQVVANFSGAQPEAQVREFVGQLLGAASADEVAQLIAKGDEDSLQKALELDASSLEARMLLARLMVEADRHSDAIAVLEAAPETDPQIEAVLAAIRQAAVPDEERQHLESTLTGLLPKVKDDDDARAEFLTNLEKLATGDPDGAAVWRKKLSSALF